MKVGLGNIFSGGWDWVHGYSSSFFVTSLRIDKNRLANPIPWNDRLQANTDLRCEMRLRGSESWRFVADVIFVSLTINSASNVIARDVGHDSLRSCLRSDKAASIYIACG